MQPASVASGQTLTAQNYEFLQRYIYRESGILVEPDREYFLRSRLQEILDDLSYPSLNELCIKLQRSDSYEVRRRVVEAMTTNETLFFRDARPFDALRQQILPKLLQQRAVSKTL